MSEPCKHLNFHANVEVARLSASETDDTIIGFTTDITVKCTDCGTPFEFIGLPMGYSPAQPMCSVDGLEARMPIKPQGAAMPADITGFKVRRVV